MCKIFTLFLLFIGLGCGQNDKQPNIGNKDKQHIRIQYQRANLLQLSQPDSAIALLQSCIDQYRQSDSSEGLMNCYCKLTHIYSFYANQPILGRRYADSAVLLSRGIDSLKYKALYAQGMCQMKAEDYDSACFYLLTALKSAPQKPDSNFIVTINGLLSNIFFTEKNYALALEYYQPILALANQRCSTSMDVIAYINAYCYSIEINKEDSSVKYLFKAREMADKIKDSAAYSVLFYNLALHFLALKQFDSALYYNQQSIDYSKSKAVSFLQSEKPYLLLTEINLQQKNYINAQQNFRQIGMITDTGKLILTDKEAYYKHGFEIYNFLNKPKIALFHLAQHLRLVEQRHENERSEQLLSFEKEKKKLAAEKTIALKNREINNQKKYSLIVTLFSVLLSAFAVREYLTWRKKKRLEEQKRALLITEKELESQRKILEERTRIAQDMHDDLGSTLTTTLMAVELIKMKPDAIEPLEMIQNAANKLSDQINEVIWNLNLKNDRVSSLSNYIISSGRKFLKQAGIELQYKENITDDHMISGEKRRQIYLVIKELLNNIVKHANATKASICIENDAHLMKIVITDNGIGIDFDRLNQKDRSGNGLNNLQYKIQSMGGQIQWTNDKGTKVSIEVSIK